MASWAPSWVGKFLVGSKDDHANSDSDSEYFDAEDQRELPERGEKTPNFTSIAAEQELDTQNSKLIKSIHRRNVVEVVQSMNDCNQWILKQRIWYLNAKDNLHKKNALGPVEEFGEPWQKERDFLEKCIKKYSERGCHNVTATHEIANQTRTDEHIINPKCFEISIDSNVPDVECQMSETDTPGSISAQIVESDPDSLDTPFFSFLKNFRVLLENKYSHLTEEQIFATSSSNIVNDFESLKKCSILEQFQDFFSHLTMSSTVTEEVKTLLQGAFFELFNEMQIDPKGQQKIHKLILEELQTFFIYFIDTRAETMDQFEQFECQVYKRITSFDYLRTKCSFELLKVFEECEYCIASQRNCNRIIEMLQDQHSKCSPECTMEAVQHREDVYQKEVELYQKLLEVVSTQTQVDTTVIERILKSNINHFSYLHENLIRLIKLLWQIVQPYNISSKSRDESTVYTITMVAGLSSNALSVFYEWISRNKLTALQSGDEIRLCADAVLYADSNVCHPKLNFHGVSVVCIAPKLIKKMTSETNRSADSNASKGLCVSINTNGKNIKCRDIPRPIKATSGDDGTETAKDGKAGDDGENGRYGNAGGHILLVASNICHEHFNLSANGSLGEDGQSGGDGGAGWSPNKDTAKGKDGTDPTFEKGWLKNNSSVVISFGTRGNDSGRGGDAGMSGAAGKSGVSGKIEILDLNNELNCPTSQEQAEDGKPGQPGNPGKGGKHTTHGTDRGKYGTTLGLFSKIRTMVTRTRPLYTITSMKGELCHDEIPYDRSIPHPTVETYEKPANNKRIKRVKEDDHPDFVDRGCNRDGETAKVKVNNSLANENKAVDKQACFQALRDQCRQSFQHWNCESHNRFLGEFAKKIGELHHSDLIGTRSGAIRSNHVMWISQLHSISESTEVSITYKAEEYTQAHHLKDYEKKQNNSSVNTDSTLCSESAETRPLSVDVSSLKQRAKQKNIQIENYLLESLLKNYVHDDEIENLQATLNLSEESIHFVRCNTADFVTEHQSRFLIMQNLKTKAWIFRDPSGTTHNMTVTSSLEVLTMEDNQLTPLNRDTMMYEEIVSWICGVVGEDTEIPATTKQVLCLKKLKLIILIKKSYNIVGKKCDSEEMISLINKLFGICLDRIIKSNSLFALDLLVQECRDENKDFLLLALFDLNLIKSVLSKDMDGNLVSNFFESIGHYNGKPSLEKLLSAMETFREYHLNMLETSTSYITNLTRPDFRSFLKTFEKNAIHDLHFLGGELNLSSTFQDVEMTITDSEAILPGIIAECSAKKETYSHLKTYFKNMSKHGKKKVCTSVEHMFSRVIDTAGQLLGIDVLTFREQLIDTENIEPSFSEANSVFSSCPSLTTVLPVVVTLSGSNSPEEIQEILSYIYSQVRHVLEMFHELMSVVNFKCSVSKIGFEIVDFLKVFRQLSFDVTRPDLQALIHILDHILKITSETNSVLLQDPSVLLQDPSMLLISVTKVLEGMYLHYNNLFHISPTGENHNTEVERRNQLIKGHVKSIAEFHATFLAYPMSCPLVALMRWKKCIECEIIPKLEQKVELLKTSSDNNVLENLGALKRKLQNLSYFLSKVINSRNSFKALKSCKDLQIYSLVYNPFYPTDTELPEVLTKDIIGLGKLNGNCLKTIVAHFGQHLLSSSHFRLSVEMERSEPTYEFLVMSEEPSVSIEPYTVILVINDVKWKWKLYFSSDTANSELQYQCRDVKLSEIKQIEDMPGYEIAMKNGTRNGSFSLTNEQKAHLISIFKFDTEYNVSHRVHFGSQILFSGTKCLLSFLSIDIKTCAVKISDGTVLEDDDSLGQSILVVLCNSTSSEALEHLRRATYLEISKEQFTSEIKESVGVFVVKYPDQPAIVKTVTKCGEKELLKHHYSLSLHRESDNLSFWSLLSDSSDACTYRLLLIDNSERNDVTFLEVLQPILKLLKDYQELYDNLLPTHILNNGLKFAMEPERCPTVCCHQSIVNLVRSVRRYFVQKCMNLIIFDSDHVNFRAMRRTAKHMLFPKCTSAPIEDIHLLAIESFLHYKMVMNDQRSVRIKQLQLCDVRKASYSFRFWEKALVMKTFKEDEVDEEVVSICRASVYLKKREITKDIDCEVGPTRFNMYNSILKGLKLLLADEEVTSEVSNHIKRCILKQYVEEDNDSDEDIEELLEVMKANEYPWKLIDKHLVDITPGGLKVCISKQLFAWFNVEMYNILQLFQDILSFFCHKNKVLLIGECTNCLCNRADQALKNPTKWVSLIGLIQVFRSLAHDLNSRIQKHVEYRTLETDLLHNMLMLVRLVKNSSDVSKVLSIVQENSSDLWLSRLLANSLYELCVKQYDDTGDLDKKLILVHAKFLQILYNVFVNDVSNPSASLSFEKLSVIVDLLPYIEPCPAAFSALCKTKISCWEEEIHMIHFKQYFDHWKDLTGTDKQRTIYMMNRVRLYYSGMTHIKFMTVLYKLRSKYIQGKVKDCKLLMCVFEALYYKRISLEQLNDISGKQWRRSIITLLNMTITRKFQNRNADDVLELIHNQLQVDSGESEHGICDVIIVRDEAREVLQHLEHFTIIPKTAEKELKTFFGLLQRYVTIEEKMRWLERHRVQFVSSITKSWILSSVSGSDVQQVQVPYNTQIVSLLLFLHSRDQGLLQQVKTGEGKTLIVGMLAGAKALLGFNVDVVSSNRDLAQSGMEKCQPFFNILGLKAAINCTDDDDTNQQAYKVHIVYGDVGSFQRDMLQEESKPGKSVNFKNRYSEPEKNCLIVDEVDSMFLDKAQHMLYLSHDSPALKHLETLFLHIWSAMISISSHSSLTVPSRLKEMTNDMNTLIENGTILVPDYLKEFCFKKMESWIQSAHHAMTMDADDQFVIDHQKQGNSKVKRIFPIDKQTGIEQYNMKWSNGLSQFLELKYRRPISSESLKAVFISNKRFFRKYDKQLFGLTGTLGSVTSRNLLQNVYNINTVELPTNKPKRFTQSKSRIASSEQDWCACICDELSDRTSDQPVLVICENIKRLESVKHYMLSHSTISENDLISYARDGDNVEKTFEGQHGAKPGQIVLATNKGGRGTDIVISDKDVPKGLHVILTFLPENTRIEEQAFGRAARAGQAGSGCLIIQINQQEYKSVFQTFNSLEAATEILVEKEKIKRDKTEKSRLHEVQSKGLLKLDLEEHLYLLFQKCRKSFTLAIENLSLMDVQICKAARSALIGVVTNHWAYWLDSMHAQIHSVSSESEKQLVIDLFSKDFPAQGYPLPSSINDTKFFKHPESYVTLGIGFLEDVTEYSKGNHIDDNGSQHLNAALTCFQQADKTGDLTGLPAMASCYCFIKLNPEASRANMKQARHYLKKARTRLISLKQTWMVNVEVGTTLSKLMNVSQYIHDDENHYNHQVEEKLKILGLHLHTVELLLGNIIDKHSFVNESTLTDEKISEVQSEQIYKKLVTLGFVCDNKVRKYWKNRTVLRQFILEKVDEQVSVPLIELILNKPVINESDLIDLVNSSDELWDIISPLLETSVNVRVIFASKVDSATLEDDSLNIWNEFKNSFETDRIDLPWDDERTNTYKEFLAYLEGKNLCKSTKKGLLKQDSVIMMESLELGKYASCYMNIKAHKQTLRSYLLSLFEYCQQNEDCYLLEHMLPYGNKAFEAKKLHAFLQVKDILKSGQLVQHKYGVGKELQHAIATSLGKESTSSEDDYTPFQVDFIVRILGRLQGEVRKFERKMHVDFVDFNDLPDRPEEIPEELAFFAAWHMDQFLSIEQVDKGYWDWNAFACATLGMAQVIGGAALLSLGVTASIGSALIAEGVNDMVYATMAGLTGTFTWKDYAIHKSISLALTIATGGISALANRVKVGSKLGSASPFSAFINATSGATKKFVLHTATSYISDVVLQEIQESVVHATIYFIENLIISKCMKGLHSQLKNLAQQVNSDDEFHNNCQRIVSNIRTSLGMNTLLPADFDLIRSQVVSSLQSNYRSIVENLGNSNSTSIRLLSKGAKVAYYANRAISVVTAGVRVGHAAVAVHDLFKGSFNSSPEYVRQAEDIDSSLIEREAAEIKDCLIQFIHQQLHEKLRREVHSTVKNSLKGVAKASRKAVSSAVTKVSTPTFINLSASIVNDKQVSVSDHDEHLSTEGVADRDHDGELITAAAHVQGEIDTTSKKNQDLDLHERNTFQSEILPIACGGEDRLEKTKKSVRKNKKKKKLDSKSLFLSDNPSSGIHFPAEPESSQH